MSDPIKSAIQTVLDACGDGWACADYVCVVGLERLNTDGELETVPWWMAPARQASWVTDGLVVALGEMRSDITQDLGD